MNTNKYLYQLLGIHSGFIRVFISDKPLIIYSNIRINSNVYRVVHTQDYKIYVTKVLPSNY